MYLRFDNITRQETDPVRISTLLRKGWVEFTPEVVPVVPAADAPAWAIRAALRVENLLAAVGTAIAALSEPRKSVALERFSGSIILTKTDPLIRYLAANVPAFTDAKIDAVFATANEIAAGKLGA